jgi:hypothetical protein
MIQSSIRKNRFASDNQDQRSTFESRVRRENAGMFEKKLVTLCCAVGILACGACFLPPLPERKTPLPPALASVHNIAIHVEDGTAGNLFDPLIMSNATAGNFNRLWNEFAVRAEGFSTGKPSDAALRITVLRKTASCIPGDKGRQFCSIEMIASFNVTAADGRILQSNLEERSKFGLWVTGNSLPETWNSNPFRQEAAYALARTAGVKLLLSEHPN